MNIDITLFLFGLSLFVALLSFLGLQLWNSNKELSRDVMQIKIDLGRHDSDIKAISDSANRIEKMLNEHEAKRAIFLDTFQQRVADTMRPYIEIITAKFDAIEKQLHEREKK